MKRASAVTGVVLVLVAALGAGVAPATAATGAESAADLAQGECSYPTTVTDATDTEVTIEEEPGRIVTLAPSAAQTLWELNASGKVVGVSSNADYLEGSDQKEVISQATAQGTEYRIESIVGLQPDLVLAPDIVSNETIETLRSDGLTVYKFEDAQNFDDLYETVELTGRLAGECAAGNATATDMRERVTAISNAVEDEDRPGAMYTFYGYAAGGNTFIDAIITTAGTENIAATEAGITSYGRVSPEIVANNTDRIEWLILNTDEGSHPSGDVWNETVALQEDQTVVVNEDYLNQPAPRTVLALETITEAIHPEAYEEAQAALEPTPTPATEGPDGTDGSGADGTTASETDGDDTADDAGATDEVTADVTATDESGPGFTAAVAVGAMLAVGLFARRR